jgi:hypothetical protein
MAEISITAQANREIQHRLMRLNAHYAALLLLKRLPDADLKRGRFGEVLWSVDRPEGWSAEVGSIAPMAAALCGVALEVFDVDGIRVAVLALDKPPTNLRIDWVGGALHVREPDA